MKKSAGLEMVKNEIAFIEKCDYTKSQITEYRGTIQSAFLSINHGDVFFHNNFTEL